ncbi:hypothetical protein F0562_001326 [Nyssa sinensis]|uniref:Uncharacterized protein n=1 Tax=Nyssa sinensis TaxID=561372 RepID=A0A5J5C3W9_9ASTE|nr:hypothetical protein F0562_001326 [Nyssa sinensis]
MKNGGDGERKTLAVLMIEVVSEEGNRRIAENGGVGLALANELLQQKQTFAASMVFRRFMEMANKHRFVLRRGARPLVFNGTPSPRPTWLALANKFASPSRSRINHLKRLLQTLNQVSMKCAAYLDSAKQLTAQLGVVGKTIDDDDLIAYIVSGLNHSYHPFITSLSLATRDKALSFEDFQAELLSCELFLENRLHSIPPETNNLALFAPKHP